MTNMTHDEWLEARKSGIGGSDVAAILGVSPWKTALDVYLDKLNLVPQEPPTEAMDWGTKKEALIAEEFSRRTGLKIQRVNKILRVDDWMIANIDRAIINPDIKKTVRVLDDGHSLTTDMILECKDVNAYADGFGDSQEDEIVKGMEVTEHQIPIYYETQVQWYMGVTGVPVCYLSALIGGKELRIYRIKKREDVIDMVVERCKEFWTKNIQQRVPPEPKRGNIEDLNKLYKIDNGSEIAADIALAEKVNEYRRLKTQESEVKKQLEVIKFDILESMKESSFVTWEGKNILSAKWQERNTFQSAKFKKDHPDVYEQYCEPSRSRVVRLGKSFSLE